MKIKPDLPHVPPGSIDNPGQKVGHYKNQESEFSSLIDDDAGLPEEDLVQESISNEAETEVDYYKKDVQKQAAEKKQKYDKKQHDKPVERNAERSVEKYDEYEEDLAEITEQSLMNDELVETALTAEEKKEKGIGRKLGKKHQLEQGEQAWGSDRSKHHRAGEAPKAEGELSALTDQPAEEASEASEASAPVAEKSAEAETVGETAEPEIPSEEGPEIQTAALETDAQTTLEGAIKEKAGKKGVEEIAERSGNLIKAKESQSQTGKIFKSVLENEEGQPSELWKSQAVPVSGYFEPSVAHAKAAEQMQARPGMQVQEIQQLVDKLMVGVNASGDPELNMDLRLQQYGALNVRIIRAEEGLKLMFNTQTEKAGVQLAQNIQMLESALAQRGLKLDSIQLLVQNQVVPINELIEQAKPTGETRDRFRDSSKTKRQEKQATQQATPKKR